MAINLNTKIQLYTGEIIDIADDVAVPFNMSIAEIQDISKRQGGYSKTILCAGTANNRRIFTQLFKANVVDTSFDLGVRKKCIYIENGTSVFRGYLQLLNVNKISKNNIDGDGEVTFEVALRDDTGDFYSVISDKYLNDLDFGDMNHVYELSAITATSAYTSDNGYVYNQYQTSNTPNWYIEDFRPSIFALQYWDRILADAGYTYTWSDLTDIKFDKMIIPYNGDEPRIREEEALADLFRASYATGTTGQTIALTTGQALPLIFNDDSDSTRNLFDTGGNYNPTTGVYSIPNHFFNTFETKFTYEIYLSASTGCTLNAPTGFVNYNFKFEASGTTGSIYIPTVFEQKLAPNGYVLNQGLNLFASGDTYQVWNNQGYGVTTDFKLGILYATNQQPQWVSGATFATVYPVIKIIANSADTSQNYFRNWINVTNVAQGSTIYMNDFVPQKIKQKDFIADVVKMFNLYITYDKDKNNHLIIKTRDNFYDEGAEQDISDLLDIEQEYSIKYLPDLQKKKLLFTYKEAKDFQSKTYKESTNEIYGQYEYTFDNEFVRDTLTIGNSLFEETPLLPNIDGNVTSVIDSIAPKSGVKIIYNGGWITGNTWSISVFTTGNVMATTTFDTYPYAGHFYPNPINPTDDLNYGLNDYLYYNSWDRLTLSNLYNNYYKRFVDQIENGKLLTGYFKLDEHFILNLDFSTKYYIHDSWWILNRIIDYNANGFNGLTKCEFISVDSGINFNQQYITSGVTKPAPADWVNTTPRDLTVYNQVIGPLDGTVHISGTKNVINGGVQYVDVKGSFNNVSNTKSAIITGSGNTVSNADNTFVIGDDNTATTKNSIVIGDGIVTGDLEGVYADNLIISSGGTIEIGGQVIYSGGTFEFCDSGITVNDIYACTTAVTFHNSIQYVGSTASGAFSVALGQNNIASNYNSSVVGGNNNVVSNINGFIGGGANNSAIGINSSVVGGENNISSGLDSTIGGGNLNRASGYYSFIGAGLKNSASTSYSIICGGYANNAYNQSNATIVNGNNNIAKGANSFIGNGYNNKAQTNRSFIGNGYKNHTTYSGLFNHQTILNGFQNSATTSSYATVINGYKNTVSGGHSTVINGSGNIASGAISFIGNGGYAGYTTYGNTASGNHSFIGNGQNNTASAFQTFIGNGNNSTANGSSAVVVNGNFNTSYGFQSFIGNGSQNIANYSRSTILNGQYNSATTSNCATVINGAYNLASGIYSTLINGKNNTVSGTYSTIGGGSGNILTGNYSAIIGGQNITGTSNNTVYVPNLSIEQENTIYLTTGGTASTSGVIKLTGGTATVTTSAVLDSSIIILTTQSNAGNIGSPYVNNRTTTTSFVINSTDVSDANYVAWIIYQVN